METNLEDLYAGLFSILSERGKPILENIILVHKKCEKELLDEIETYKADNLIEIKEIDDIVDQIESLANEIDQSVEVTTKLKERINKFRKNRKEP